MYAVSAPVIIKMNLTFASLLFDCLIIIRFPLSGPVFIKHVHEDKEMFVWMASCILLGYPVFSTIMFYHCVNPLTVHFLSSKMTIKHVQLEMHKDKSTLIFQFFYFCLFIAVISMSWISVLYLKFFIPPDAYVNKKIFY